MTRLSVVAASLTRFCRVCKGSRSIPLVSLLGIPTRVWVECPHCVGVAGMPAEIPELPYREDQPRGAA